MGGDSYDRAVIQSNNIYSSFSQNVYQATNLNQSMDPKRFTQKSQFCNNKSPIIFAIDVTGSMGDWTKVYYL